MKLKFWKRTAPGDGEESGADEDRTLAIPHDAATATAEEHEVPVTPVRNLKKRLITGGAIGLLVILLAGIGFALPRIPRSHPQQKPATAEASPARHPAARTETSQAEIAALKKKNEELQAQIEAAKKLLLQAQSPAAQRQQTNQHTASSAAPIGGEMTVSNKDPRAAAQALKAAIEAMNTGSEGQKIHKPDQ